VVKAETISEAVKELNVTGTLVEDLTALVMLETEASEVYRSAIAHDKAPTLVLLTVSGPFLAGLTADKQGDGIMKAGGYGYGQKQSEYSAALIAAQSSKETQQHATGSRARKKRERESV